MAITNIPLSTKAVIKVKVSSNPSKMASSTYNINPDVTDEIIYNSMLAINSLMSINAEKVTKIITSELLDS